MSEVEKLYKNAGVGYLMYVVDTFPSVAYPQIDFTAEKQLELIKWLAYKAHNGLLINKHITDGGASMVFDNLGYESILASSFISFEECIAKLTNSLWQSLTEEEKQQVKGILE